MNSILDAVTDALATYRLTRLVVEDEITQDLRDRLWNKYPPESTKLGYLVSCYWCSSMSIGAAVVLARTLAPAAWNLASKALAASTVAGLIDERNRT